MNGALETGLRRIITRLDFDQTDIQSRVFILGESKRTGHMD